MKVLTKLFMRSIELIVKLSMDFLLYCLSNSIKLTTIFHFFKNEFKSQINSNLSKWYGIEKFFAKVEK
jgi:hypothetical protein